jgi:hypothetical protein
MPSSNEPSAANPPGAPITWSEGEILEAFNRAADETIAMDDCDQALVDAVNMVVNLGIGYLQDPHADQDQVIEEAWSTDNPAEMRGWVVGH